MNVSFKAKLEGLNSPTVTKLFEIKTKKHENDTVVFTKGLEKYNSDSFALYKNDKKIAEYKTEFDVNESKISLDRLLSIFNILKMKEAQVKLDEIKNKKAK